MARPIKTGLSYFSFDTDFFLGTDRRITRLQLNYGNNGLIFYIYILAEAYRNGYYLSWDEDSIKDASSSLKLKEGFIKQVMEYLVSRGLVYRVTLDSQVTILTSPGIQKRYQEAKKGLKREIEVDPEIWLLNDKETAAFIKCTSNENKSGINPSKSGINEGKSEKNSLNKSKENNNSINKKPINTISPEPKKASEEPPIITLLLNDKSDFPITQKMIDEYKELYPGVDVLQELRNMKGWLLSNPTRRKTKRGITRFINTWLCKEQDRSKGTVVNNTDKDRKCFEVYKNILSMHPTAKDTKALRDLFKVKTNLDLTKCNEMAAKVRVTIERCEASGVMPSLEYIMGRIK